jgi:sialic acid synthase SpsE
LFVAEIGLNHLGSETRARKLTNALLDTSVDAITFQIREDSFYQPAEISRHRLSEGFYQDTVRIVHQHGKSFGLATCDPTVIPFFAATDVDFWKTLSWDFTNSSLMDALLATGKNIFMSTGLSGMGEIVTVSRKYRERVVLIHTSLSVEIEEVNLKAIDSVRRQTGLPVAFGLHCDNHEVLKLALSFDPEGIFFYVKDRGTPGLFDDGHAVFADRVGTMVDDLKLLHSSLGTGVKSAMRKPGWVK